MEHDFTFAASCAQCVGEAARTRYDKGGNPLADQVTQARDKRERQPPALRPERLDVSEPSTFFPAKPGLEDLAFRYLERHCGPLLRLTPPSGFGLLRSGPSKKAALGLASRPHSSHCRLPIADCLLKSARLRQVTHRGNAARAVVLREETESLWSRGRLCWTRPSGSPVTSTRHMHASIHKVHGKAWCFRRDDFRTSLEFEPSVLA